jgi:Amt family ammonium transporter
MGVFLRRTLLAAVLAFPATGEAVAQQMSQAIPPAASTLNSGDTAWMLTSTALVLMMTIPGLALFYGGMVRKMNVLATLICGAFADRMKFSALLWFIGLWAICVYAPIAHWVWGPDGFLNDAGVLDFAGGTVVHINSGVAGLMAALVMGKRRGFGSEPMPPHNLVFSVAGASLLWVGWFGFNAGSATAANGNAGMAMAVTQIATATAALSWMFAEWMFKGKPSVLGIISGAVAGLVAITPASGFVDPRGALIIGIAAGVICYWRTTGLKHALGYDDSLDAFGVHGVGGAVGALLTGVLAVAWVGGEGKSGLIDGNPHQVLVQLYAIVVVAVYDAIASILRYTAKPCNEEALRST